MIPYQKNSFHISTLKHITNKPTKDVIEILKVMDKGLLLEVNGKYHAHTHSKKKGNILNKQKNLTLKMLMK